MDNRFQVYYLKANAYINLYTYAPGPELGLFRLRGTNLDLPLQNHQLILADISDDGHRLTVGVHRGPTGRLVIENTGDPATNATFSYKHLGTTKKSFKPGEIISPPEAHILTWVAPNLNDGKDLVILTLTPLFDLHGLRVHYTLFPKL